MSKVYSSREVIERGLASVAAALNQRPPRPATVDVWDGLFGGDDPRLLATCFRQLAEESEKFPSPRRMRSLLAQFKSSNNPAPTHTDGFDAEGQPCWFWSDEPTVPAYHAEHSPEWLECTAKHRELRKTKRLTGAREEKARRAELQTQKMRILREREPGEEG
jgi:hypothetical protein